MSANFSSTTIVAVLLLPPLTGMTTLVGVALVICFHTRAIAIAMYNIPDEFAMAVPMVAVKKKRLLYTVAFLSGLAEPVGAILGFAAVALHPSLNALFVPAARIRSRTSGPVVLRVHDSVRHCHVSGPSRREPSLLCSCLRAFDFGQSTRCTARA
jgi:hypothetical protein